MKKLIILIVAVLALGAIYIWVLPIAGIDTTVSGGDPYQKVVKEREKNFGRQGIQQNPQASIVANAEPDIEDEGAPKVSQVAAGQLTGSGTHKAKGSVELFSVGNQYGIRYSDFSFDSGTNLHVYLTSGLSINATNSVDLGPVNATSGVAFYRVPQGVNIKQYKYVAVWSVDKKELYNYAEILIK